VRVSPSFPTPKKITLPDDGEIVGENEVASWLGMHGRDPDLAIETGLAPASLRKKPIYALLGRAARMRQHWLRADTDDIQASKIVNDPNWAVLSKVLEKHDYLRVETRQASGRSSKFFHIKHREEILAEAEGDLALKEFFETLHSV
jgi:hypothetical protein